MTKPSIDKRFITNLQGKDYVTYEGLLDLAHQKGLISIKTDLIQLPTRDNNSQCIMKAVAITEKGQFEGYGDADPSNVNSFISKHLIRMAETRAKARALRDLTNVGMTAIEELGGEEEDKSTQYTPNVKQSTTKPTGQTKYICSDCNVEINQAVNEYSTKNFGKPLCINCQKNYKK